MKLSELIGTTLNRVKVTNTGNVFTGNGITCLLKPVNRTFDGTTKKPLYYLSTISNGKSEYLSGLFVTNDPDIFSADYKDALGLKHIVHIEFADGGSSMSIRAV